MAIPEYQQRVIDERVELGSKLDKLQAFMASEKFADVDRQQRELLQQQLNIMTHYYDILSARISYFAAS